MSQSPFRKRKVADTVKTELTARGAQAGLTWNAKKFPWVHVTSLCSECKEQSDPNNPDKKEFTILSSLGLGPLYEKGYIRPLPTIQSVEVKKQGELGTTRRAIIKIMAYTDAQLVELQRCYFMPAMGVRVEWGWSVGAAYRDVPPPLGSGTRTYSDAIAICKMNEQENGNPNYCGLQGIVANFSYNLTTDNYWDCTLEVIAASEAVSGAKVNTYNCGCKRKNEIDTDDGKKKVDRVESDLAAHLRDLQENYDQVVNLYKGSFANYGSPIQVSRRSLKDIKQRNESGGEASVGFWRGWGEYFAGKVSNETWISWGMFEAMINCIVMDVGKDGASQSKLWLGQLRSSNVLISYHPALESSDPKVCYIPGTNYSAKTSKYISGDDPGSALSGKFVRLSGIMLNVIFLLGELRAAQQGEGTLMTFLNSVLDKISSACGNLWALEAVSGTECCEDLTQEIPPIITVIDVKVYEAAPPFEVLMMPTNSYVRDFKLEMRMTDAMKTQALYSGGPIAKMNSPSGGNCDADAFKAFNIDDAGRYNLAKGRPTKRVASDDCPGGTGSPAQSNAKLDYDSLFEKMVDEGPSNANVDACRSILMEGYSVGDSRFPTWRAGGIRSILGALFSKDYREHCKGVPLPFNFSFTVDGVGGFKFGQMVTCDRIPDSIRKNFEWQITTVEHSITTQDWTTTVNTICRFKNIQTP